MAKNKYNQVFATGITSNTDDLLFIYEAISLKDEFIVQAVRGGFEEGDPRHASVYVKTSGEPTLEDTQKVLELYRQTSKPGTPIYPPAVPLKVTSQ